MTPKVETCLRLITKGEQDPAKLFQGMCFLLEVAEDSPQDLDPVALALIQTLVKPVVRKTEAAMGIKEGM